ncbi:MAG: PadR family transcriptional regulator [Candidatus Hadarchaeum sp.]
MDSEKEYVTNLTKFYTLALLAKGPKHGYELMEELEKKIGKKPSAGQIYPLLKKLENKGLIVHEVIMVGKRRKKVYTLTTDGKRMASQMIGMFSNMISGILEPKLTKCAHCGCKVYEGGHAEKIGGRTLMFCCVHCANSYKKHIL